MGFRGAKIMRELVEKTVREREAEKKEKTHV